MSDALHEMISVAADLEAARPSVSAWVRLACIEKLEAQGWSATETMRVAAVEARRQRAIRRAMVERGRSS